MLALTSYIKITDPTGIYFLAFGSINEVIIEKSRRNLTTTSSLKLGRRIIVLDAANGTVVDINSVIKRGAAIEMQLGYNGNLKTEFTGYVTGLGAKIPVEIKCEDEMWKLKQNSFSKAWKNIKVAEVVSFIYSGPAQVVDLEIGGLVVKQMSTAQILDELKKFGLQCYFFNGTLIVDFAGVVHNKGKEVDYDFYQNIIENNLDYKRKEDALIKVRGVSKLPNGKKIEIIAGDNGGEEHTLHYYNLKQDELQKIVTSEIEAIKYDGYKGSFTTFGLPYAEPGDIAVLNDIDYPEHSGAYLIEAVKTTFGMQGFRREVTLERKVA